MIESVRLVSVLRGKLTECVHRGHAVLVNTSGDILASSGDPHYVTYARSSAKPLQAIPVLESGAAERFAFGTEETALLCASHNGELRHVETAAGMLAKMGLTEAALQCGAHEPSHRPAAQALREAGREPGNLHNNCSGKHSGMLALALQLGAPLETYLQPEHPVQRMMLRTISDMSGVPEDRIILGIDGCGVPVFGLPLAALAQAFARLGTPGSLATPSRRDACGKIIAAIRSAPWFLAGTNRFDTALIEATGGRIICKGGAEGVFALCIPERGLGLAVKVEDGAHRAVAPTVLAALRELQLLNAAELEQLSSYHRPEVRNWQGTLVGRIEPELSMKRK